MSYFMTRDYGISQYLISAGHEPLQLIEDAKRLFTFVFESNDSYMREFVQTLPKTEQRPSIYFFSFTQGHILSSKGGNDANKE